ncbi:hypothetical protein [Cellulomonas wangsupingiae]|uniref:hypothetical protein n=1 Tax=Cellulomonas wangsupingiae TaxID=2968085 RepID=UPI001D0E866E|nr:hypothetical protein [Cellulomonas wangsupingiae]MCM0639264.1 hypothetical protein [Cellulomonas wangsupingiae]
MHFSSSFTKPFMQNASFRYGWAHVPVRRSTFPLVRVGLADVVSSQTAMREPARATNPW